MSPRPTRGRAATGSRSNSSTSCRAGGPLPFERFERDLVDALGGRLDVAAKLDQRIHGARRSAPAGGGGGAAADRGVREQRGERLVDDDRHPGCRRAGRAVPVSGSTLTSEGLDIRSAKVATLGHEVVDVFYVRANPWTGPGPRRPTEGDPARAARSTPPSRGSAGDTMELKFPRRGVHLAGAGPFLFRGVPDQGGGQNQDPRFQGHPCGGGELAGAPHRGRPV